MRTASIEVLHEADCIVLLRTERIGRVGVRHGQELLILPVYYAMLDNKIVFRTAPGAKLDAAVLGQSVTFEVDHDAPAWSVLLHGHAAELRSPDEIVNARAHLDHEWPTGERERYVSIAIERIVGRRLRVATS